MLLRLLGAPLLVLLSTASTACRASGEDTTDPPAEPTPSPASTTAPPPPAPTTVAPPAAGVEAPAWLGTRPLALRPDGLGVVSPTPPELRDRRFWPVAALAPPAGAEFEATVAPVPDAVLARSTWGPHCPVGQDDLRYLTVSFVGFDERFHTGELVVHVDVADAVVEVFRRIHAARFPIEEMRVVAADELDAPPTGDGNNTSSFVCRSVVEGESWSQHAYGLAIDVNPFHNPYRRGDVVVPELASAYLDRADHRPGMIQPGDAVTEAFAAIGWHWGGDWPRTKDWMHFSATGR